jgi:hypothetical protein
MRPVLAVLAASILTVALTGAPARHVLAQQTPAPMTPALPAPTDEFGAKVRAYLLAHPEVIMEAVQELRQRQEAAQAEATKAAIAEARGGQGRAAMMQGYGSMMPMMWGMGLLWFLVLVVLILGAAALLKYLLSGRRRGDRNG